MARRPVRAAPLLVPPLLLLLLANTGAWRSGGGAATALVVRPNVPHHAAAGRLAHALRRRTVPPPFLQLPARRSLAVMTSSADAAPPPPPQQTQKKAKTKQDRFELQFTCNVCESRNSHSISRHAYTKGTVIVTCPTCNSTHLIADHLNWIEDDFRNLEEFMAKRGTPVERIVRDNTAADAAAEAVARLMAELGEDGEDGGGAADEAASAASAVPDKLDGITDDQALRIREAVRAAKRRKREEQGQ